MFPVHNILHGTDFSEQSKSALTMACAIARDTRARITLVHVSPPPMASGEVYAIITDSREVRQELRERLEQMVPAGSSIPFDLVLVEGDPARQILRVASEKNCDLIVIGTHGRKGLTRMLMGSVAEEVVRNAECPVLTIKNPLPQVVPAEMGGKDPSVALA